MSKAAVSKIIAGVEYTVTPLTTTEGIKVLNRLQKIIAGGAKNPDQFVSGLLEALTEADLLYLTDVFKKLTLVTIGDKAPLLKDVYEDHFAQDFGALAQWLQFCLEVNFSSLFTYAGEMGAKFSAPAPVSQSGKSGPLSVQG